MIAHIKKPDVIIEKPLRPEYHRRIKPSMFCHQYSEEIDDTSTLRQYMRALSSILRYGDSQHDELDRLVDDIAKLNISSDISIELSYNEYGTITSAYRLQSANPEYDEELAKWKIKDSKYMSDQRQYSDALKEYDSNVEEWRLYNEYVASISDTREHELLSLLEATQRELDLLRVVKNSI